ncbi:MAG: DUF503 domain-containing protein [Kofleriaceae bacterium]
MYVALAKLVLVVGHSRSLKDKRMVIRRIKDRVKQRIGVLINEVGALDDHQRGELGCATVSADRHKAGTALDDVVRIAMTAADGQIVEVARDIITFDAPTHPVPPVDDRTGAGDKASAGDDEWIPAAWRDSDS